jgi:Sulfatase-modifying factor enzyme 1
MSKKKAEKPVEIKFKSLLGIPPGLYLLILYVFAAVSILFLIFFLPGIINYGSQVSFSTTPDGAATYYDDVYIGSGEFSEFIPKGNHTISFKKFGYRTVNIERNIGGRLLFSWMFPRRIAVTSSMKLDSLDDYLYNKAKTLYEWSYVTDYSSNYFYPEVFTALATDLSTTELTASQIIRVAEFYKHTSALISSEEMLTDYLHGSEILSSAYVKEFTEKLHVEFLQSYYSGKDILSSESDQIQIDIQQDNINNDFHTFSIFNTSFITLSSNEVLIGDPEFSKESKLTEYPSLIEVDQFSIAIKEVSVRDFARFVENNSSWAITNKQNLIQNGLVDDQYLLDIDLQYPDEMPIRNISWFAADAYCDWVSASIDNEDENVYMTLPTNAQWQYAASAFSGTYTSTLSSAPVFINIPVNLMGNVWEFSSDIFIPTGSSLYESIDTELKDEWTQRVVLGGSWANSPSDISYYSIGSIEPYSCSEFIGFRPVLLQKD